jgi:uncharacterized protein YdeI (YjbR/CyaY-like superfamily)
MDDTLQFANRKEFRDWLTDHHSVIIFGKSGKLQTVGPDEALEEALCFGWIDGQIKSIDESSYMKKFTQRRKGSNWSERNKKIAAKLIEQGLMTEHGLAAIERAKKDGTWDSPKRAPISDEQIALLLKALKGREPALSNFRNMPPSVQRTYTAHYLDAKSEDTRKRRLESIVARLNENKRPM